MNFNFVGYPYPPINPWTDAMGVDQKHEPRMHVQKLVKSYALIGISQLILSSISKECAHRISCGRFPSLHHSLNL